MNIGLNADAIDQFMSIGDSLADSCGYVNAIGRVWQLYASDIRDIDATQRVLFAIKFDVWSNCTYIE